MSKSFKFLLLFSLLLISKPIHGTGQVNDMLIFKADTFQLIGLPLTQYLDESRINPDSMFKGKGCFNTGNYRRYIATWAIENDKLFLLKIANDCTGEKNPDVEYADLNRVFPKLCVDGKVFADWFSGVLYCPYGKIVFYNYADYTISRENELELNIQNGNLKGVRILDNSKSRQVPYDTLRSVKYFDSKINWAIIPDIPNGELRVRLQFSANDDGEIDDVKVYPKRGDVYEMEAIRVVKTLPGSFQIYHGKLKRFYWNLTVRFSERSRK